MPIAGKRINARFVKPTTLGGTLTNEERILAAWLSPIPRLHGRSSIFTGSMKMLSGAQRLKLTVTIILSIIGALWLKHLARRVQRAA